jgi:multiple sugar transport system ATP-binding protein
MATLSLRKVHKRYDESAPVVECFDLDVRDGEFVVFVGPSGCGKSTTLRMIAGLEEVTDGTISIDGREVNHLPPRDRDIAMVFQNYALYPHMSVSENMAFALKLAGTAKAEIEKRVRAAAELLGITHLLARKPKQLSGGQRQRVAMGRAIVREPKCFLFDEPLSNLDAKLRTEMRVELKQLQQRLRTTTIYVTHDQEEAMTLGDRLVVMNGGVIQQCGPALSVYEKPANRFVAEFVGSPTMNFIEGELKAEQGSLWFDEGSVRFQLASELSESLSRHLDERIVMGVRPEAVQLGPFDANKGEPCLLVRLVQPLGPRMDVQLVTPQKTKLVAQVPVRSDVRANNGIEVHLDPRNLHFFAPGPLGTRLID